MLLCNIGAPARSHIKYGCFTQNNFFKKYAENIKKLPVSKYSSQVTLILNYFAFSASKRCAAQAPPF